MHKRRLLAYLLLCGAATALAGCGQSASPGNEPTNAQKPVLELTAAGGAQPVGSSTSSTSPPAISDGKYQSAANGERDEPTRPVRDRILVGHDAGSLSWPPLSEWGLKETAADALSRIGAEAVPALIAALRDPDAPVRLQAARALSRIGPEAAPAVPALTAALSDHDVLVRRNAARALGQIGPAAKHAVPELIRALGSEGK